MHGLVLEHNDRDVISSHLFIQSGSVYETSGEYGLSHLLEHMLFKAKKNTSVEKLLLDLNSLGGTFNAMTSKDYTCFFINTISRNWKKSLHLLKKIVFETNFTDIDLSTEKKVVVEEYLQQKDDIKDALFEKAYLTFLDKDNHYNKTVKGDKDNVLECTSSKLNEFYKIHFKKCFLYINCPKHLSKKVSSKAHTIFGKYLEIPKHIIPGNILLNKDLPVIDIIKGQKNQNSTVIMFKGFAYNDKRNIILDLIWDILAGSLNSLLMLEMREKRGLVYALSSFNDGFYKMGVTGLYFTCSSQDIDKVLLYILQILNKIKKHGLKENILKYSKATYINKLEYRLSNLDFSIERAMMRYFYQCKWSEGNVIKTLTKVKNTDIINTCKDVFRFDKMYIVSSGKYKNIESLEKSIHRSLGKFIQI
jgi:predicted Zn-dependent peptidase